SATGPAHDPEVREVAAHVRQAPRLVLLDQAERFVESRENRPAVDVGTRILEHDAKAANGMLHRTGRGNRGAQPIEQSHQPCLKYCTARSCFSAAARDLNVPRL